MISNLLDRILAAAAQHWLLIAYDPIANILLVLSHIAVLGAMVLAWYWICRADRAITDRRNRRRTARQGRLAEAEPATASADHGPVIRRCSHRMRQRLAARRPRNRRDGSQPHNRTPIHPRTFDPHQKRRTS